MIHPDHTPSATIEALEIPKTPVEVCGFRQSDLDRDSVTTRLASIEGKVEPITKRTSLYHYKVPVPNLPIELVGYSILHCSDIHFHRHSPRRTEEFEALTKVLETKKITPDTVVITGDIIGDSPLDISAREIAALTRIGGSCNKLFVMGNHDYYGGSEATVRTALSSAGYQELHNEVFSIVRGEARLSFYGTDDFLEGTPYPPSVGEVDKDDINILLTHNLDAFQSYYPDVFDIALSGHLHAGEVRLGPFSVLNAMKLFGFSMNLNDQIVGFDMLSERCLSYVSPGQARHSLNFNTMKPGATLLELVRAV